jgi:cytochrome c oxidase subunit 2
MPPQASTGAAEVDFAFYLVYWISLVSFILLAGGALLFLIRYRRREGGAEAVPIHHNTPLELTWSVGPLIILLVVFAIGFRGFLQLSVAPRDAMEVHVYGKRWLWEFEHTYKGESVREAGELHVPVGRAIKLIMNSQGDPAGNVLHSFFVPAFRIKADVLPNRYNVAWFEAKRVSCSADSDCGVGGKCDAQKRMCSAYQVFCTEYCGSGHSDMLAKIIVQEPEEWRAWMEGATKPPPGVPLAELGKGLFTKLACVTCHKDKPDSPAIIGPSLIGKFGATEKLADGSSVQVDENYVRESILRPAAKVVAGYQPVMPPFEGTLKDWQITALIEYVKTIK